jgi:hypothetical protein
LRNNISTFGAASYAAGRFALDPLAPAVAIGQIDTNSGVEYNVSVLECYDRTRFERAIEWVKEVLLQNQSHNALQAPATSL